MFFKFIFILNLVQIEDQLNKLDLTEITKQIDEVKFKIEKTLFSNKSILFIETKYRNSFLLIINDEFIQKSCIDNDSDQKLVTRKELNGSILKNKLKNTNTNSINILNLDIDIINQEEITFLKHKITAQNERQGSNLFNNEIEEIHENTFNGLTRLKKIKFDENQIQRIDPNLFNGLVDLEIIDFKLNEIKEIHEKTFYGLTKLKKIHFSSNQIREIHSNLFNGLVDLEIIYFYNNQIEEIHERTFNGLTKLKEIFSV